MDSKVDNTEPGEKSAKDEAAESTMSANEEGQESSGSKKKEKTSENEEKKEEKKEETQEEKKEDKKEDQKPEEKKEEKSEGTKDEKPEEKKEDKPEEKKDESSSKQTANKSDETDGKTSSKKTAKADTPVKVIETAKEDPTSKKGKDVKPVKKEVKKIKEDVLAKIESLPGPRAATDEYVLNHYGYHFERKVLSSTKRNIVYPAKGMTTVPVICKVSVLSEFEPKYRQNFLKDSIRIIRFLGGNGQEPPHSSFCRIFEIFQIGCKIYQFMNRINNVESIYTMIKKKKKFTQSQGREWMAVYCSVVNFLHDRGIAHRAICMENTLVNEKSGPKLVGNSKTVIYWSLKNKKPITQDKEPKHKDNYYFPPEAFVGPYNPANVDIWSLGILLAAIHTQRYVFNVKSRKSFDVQWKAFIKKHNLNPIVYSLLKDIFVKNPDERLTISQIMQHEYFNRSSDIERPKKKAKNSKQKSKEKGRSKTKASSHAKMDPKRKESKKQPLESKKDFKEPLSKEQQKEKPKEEDKDEGEEDEPKEPTKEQPKEQAKVQPKESAKEQTKESGKEQPKETKGKEQVKEDGKAAASSTDTSSENVTDDEKDSDDKDAKSDQKIQDDDSDGSTSPQEDDED